MLSASQTIVEIETVNIECHSLCHTCNAFIIKKLHAREKKQVPVFSLLIRFFVPLALPKVLRLGIKNKRVYFVLPSTFRTFADKSKKDGKR